MPNEPKGFFDVVNSYDPIKEVVPLAIQKFHMDMERSKFKILEDQANRATTAALTEISNKKAFVDKFKELGPNPSLDQVIGAMVETGHNLPEAEKLLGEQAKLTASMNKPIPIRGTSTSPPGFITQVDREFHPLGPTPPPKEPKTPFETFKAGMVRQPGETDASWNERVLKAWETQEDARKIDVNKANKENTTPKTDLDIYKAGHPKQEGETDAQWNARISDEYHARKVKEAVQVSVSGAAERGRAYADERFYSMFDTEIGKTTKVKGLEIRNDKKNRYLDPQDPNVKADTQSLTAVTKGMDSIKAFETGASQALDFAQTVAKDFGLKKYPKANTVAQLFQYHTGDPKVKGLKNSITTAATEYMKVINAGSNLTASELSVMGQQRAKEIIESSDNFESLTNSIKIMKREMQISGDKFTAQRRIIQERLKGYTSTESSTVQENVVPKKPSESIGDYLKRIGAK